VAERVPFETGTVAMVVAAGVGAVTTPAATEAGVPTTKAAEVVVLPVMVWKVTWGNVRVVERMDVVDDEGITMPDELQGTVIVVKTSMVVTGTGGAVVTPPEDEDVLTFVAQVMMAGLDPRWGAQIPWK